MTAQHSSHSAFMTLESASFCLPARLPFVFLSGGDNACAYRGCAALPRGGAQACGSNPLAARLLLQTWFPALRTAARTEAKKRSRPRANPTSSHVTAFATRCTSTMEAWIQRNEVAPTAPITAREPSQRHVGFCIGLPLSYVHPFTRLFTIRGRSMAGESENRLRNR
jgi:hypothetical protein